MPKIKKQIQDPDEQLKLNTKLPSELRKILSKKRGLGVVLFEENDNGLWSELINEKEFFKGKGFNIKLAETSLDVYRSPFLLDLKAKREIGGELKVAENKLNYRDLPGGEFLDRLGFFSFWDFDQSETLIFLKNFWLKLGFVYKKVTTKPKLFTKKNNDSQFNRKGKSRAILILEQLLFYKLIKGFIISTYEIYLWFYRLSWLLYIFFLKSISRDEVLWLPKEKDNQTAKKQESVEQVIAMSQVSTFKELLKTGGIIKDKNEDELSEKAKQSEESRSKIDKMFIGNYEPTIKDLIADRNRVEEKFKIIGRSNKKEIQEKYLNNNFSRKGIVINEQKPSAFWPKDSFNWDLGNFVFSAKNLKTVAVFCGILIALTSSVKILAYWDDLMSVRGRVMGEAEMALENINQAEFGLKMMDFNLAKDKFDQVGHNFASARNQLDEIKSFITVLAEVAPAKNTFKSGSNLIDLGTHLSKSANHLLSGITSVSESDDLSLSSRLNNFSIELDLAILEMELALEKSNNIGLAHLPKEHKDKFIKLRDSLPLALVSLKNLKELTTFSGQVLGDGELKRYLFIFQNTNEIRATGGFMGSFALIDFRNGKVEKIVLPEGGTYDMRTWFNELLLPPRPLQLITQRWEFQDANWWPDFTRSAENIKWFYEKAGGPTVDGVIAVNSDFFGKLLTVTGPIDLPDYGKTLTADNFQFELQKSIGVEAEIKNKPKKILSELAPIVLDRLLDVEAKSAFDLAEIINKGLLTKDIQLYFSETKLQEFVLSKNWAGATDLNRGNDYLRIVNMNIGGEKTDNAINQNIYLRTEILSDGRIINKLLIERKNIGPIDEIFTNFNNNSYLRVYVPLGSKLIEAIGFDEMSDDLYKSRDERLSYKDELINEADAKKHENSKTLIYQEDEKTVFANWSILRPGQTKDILLVYELPFRLNFQKDDNILRRTANLFTPNIYSYSLKFQKQSGKSNDNLISEIVYPNSLKLNLNYPDYSHQEDNQLVFKFLTNTDKYLVTGFTNK